MDQTAQANQVLLRHQRERGGGANLHRGIGLRSGSHPPQTTGPGEQPPPNPIDFECYPLGENHILQALDAPGSNTESFNSCNQLILCGL